MSDPTYDQLLAENARLMEEAYWQGEAIRLTEELAVALDSVDALKAERDAALALGDTAMRRQRAALAENARLQSALAAAPELLEACREVRIQLRLAGLEGSRTDLLCEAAIAKSGGACCAHLESELEAARRGNPDD